MKKKMLLIELITGMIILLGGLMTFAFGALMVCFALMEIELAAIRFF